MSGTARPSDPSHPQVAGEPDATTGANEPIRRFREIYARAAENAPFDPTAMTLATVGPDGRPSARTVLLKSVDERGFVFFTNYESRKGHELAAHPHAALCFYWPWIDRQARIEGAVERLPAEESDAYFATRPRGSQLGAWASQQSQPMKSRVALLRRVAATEARHLGRAIPRPPHWGGFLLRPDRIELWRARPSRLHERLLFCREGSTWVRETLQP